MQVQYRTEKVSTKRVYYTGTDTLRAGYALCYDRDNITATAPGAGSFNGSSALAADAALTAGYASYGRHAYVEKPAAGNVQWFAGVVAPISDGVVGPCWLELVEPDAVERAIMAWTEESCTINSTVLTVKPASYALGGAGEGPAVAVALQTRDRSSTNGLVQALLLPIASSAASLYGANSRTAVQLPTAAIWDNFPIAAMRANPFLGSLMEVDFRRPGDLSPTNFVDATYAANAAGKTPTEHIFLSNTAIGEVNFFTTTDNQAAEMQWPVPIVVSGGNAWGFEARIKQSVITDTKCGWFVGLMLGQKLVGDLIVDGGTLQTEGSLGFQAKEGDGDKVDFVYDETSQTQNEHDDDYVTQAAATYFTVGMHCNGTTIQGYLNGVASGTAISAVDIAAADFPAGKVFVPTVALKAAHADDFTLTLDWIRVAQAYA